MRPPAELSQRPKPVIKIVGFDRWPGLEEVLESVWSGYFTFRPRPAKSPSMEQSDDFPGVNWICKWMYERPVAVVRINPSPGDVAPKDLTYFDLVYNSSGVDLRRETNVRYFDGQNLTQLQELAIDLKEHSEQVYKEKVKKYRRKLSSQPIDDNSWYWFKIGLMEELAGDLNSALKAYHQSYTLSKSHRKSLLAVKVCLVMWRMGAFKDAWLCLEEHNQHFETERLETLLGVADGIDVQVGDSIFTPGHLYLLAANLCCSKQEATSNIELCQELLTKAFDNNKTRLRTLVYISLLAARISQNFANLELLATKIYDDGFEGLASIVLKQVPMEQLSFKGLWLRLSVLPNDQELMDEFLNRLDGSSTRQSIRVNDCKLILCSFRFDDVVFYPGESVRFQVRLENMTPAILSIQQIEALFADGTTAAINLGGELIPGTSGIYCGETHLDGSAKVIAVRLITETLEVIFEELPEYKDDFLNHFKTIKMLPPKPELAKFELLSPLKATNVPVKIKIESLSKLVDCDDGNYSMEDEMLIITWSQPGPKTIHYQVKNDPARVYQIELVIHDPFQLHFQTIPVSPEKLLVLLDISVTIDGISLDGWELWDSITGQQHPPTNKACCSAKYKSGDMVRAAFFLSNATIEEVVEPVFRIIWNDSLTFDKSFPCLWQPSTTSLYAFVKPSKYRVGLGEVFGCEWIVWNMTAETHHISLHHQQPDDECLVYAGPVITETLIQPREKIVICRGKFVAMTEGLVELPRFVIGPVQSSQGKPALSVEYIKPATILVTPK